MSERNNAIDWRRKTLDLTADLLLEVDGFRIVKLGDRILEIPTNGKGRQQESSLIETGIIYQALRRAGEED